MEQVQVAGRTGGGGQVAGGRVLGWLRSARDFLVATRAELSKVSWPTQDELVKATRMVVIFAIAIGIVLGIVDLLLTKVLVEGVAALGR